MADRKIKFDRYNEDGDVVATIDVAYVFHKGCKGSLYGDYPHPPEPASIEVYPVDDDITLTKEEEERAIEEAGNQMDCDRDDAADLARESRYERDDFLEAAGDW